MPAEDALGLQGPEYEMHIERGKIRDFARAMSAPLAEYVDAPNPLVPASFLITAAYSWGYSLERPRGTVFEQIDHDLSVPLHAEESVLRTSLLPGQLKAIAFNQSHRNPDVRFFEIDHVFLPSGEGDLLPDEREYLAVALAGEEAPAAVAVLDALDRALAFPNLQLKTDRAAGLHPTRTAEVVVAGRPRGYVGEIDPAVLEAYGVEGRVAWLELDLGALLDGPHGNRKYTPVSKFPSSDIDLAFVAPDGVAASQIEASLRKGGGGLLVGLDLFDVYRGPGVDDGSRSLAYRLRFQATDRTLTDDEVGKARQACIDQVSKKTGATLRA